jgi:O-Antigen ligase
VPDAYVIGTSTALALCGLAFASGGYFASDWGFLSLAFALVALLAVLTAQQLSLGRLDGVLLGGLSGLTVWTLVSAAWASGPDEPVLEAERGLLYVTATGSLLLVLRRERVLGLLAGLVAGAVAVGLYALATRLFPGRVGESANALTGSRLDEPIGYANALALLAVIGILPAVAFALGAGPRGRAAAAAALVPLAAALQFTLSRGAIAALGSGLVALLLSERDRLRTLGGLLLLAPAPALAVVLVVRSPLTDGGLVLERAEAAGARLALQLALVALVSAAAGVFLSAFARAAAPIAACALALASAGILVWVLASGPVSLVNRGLAEFRASPPVTRADRESRLLSLAGNYRADYWRVGWKMVERAPLLGEGAGAYEHWWLRERPVASYARDAHSLYLETLAELGPLGLALLAAALSAPLLALPLARRQPLAAGAAGAYVAFLVHAGLDWDWEVPLVTLPALACSAALVAIARVDSETAALTRGRRAAVSAAVAVVAAAALIGHVGNRAARAGEEALAAGDPVRASFEARRARTWAPWAARPWRLLGEAQLASRRDNEARRSLREALRRDPGSWLTWYDLAIVSNPPERARAFRRMLHLNPLGPEVAELEKQLRTNP